MASSEIIKLVELGKSSYAVHYDEHYIGYVTKRASYWQGSTADGALITKPTKTRAEMVKTLKEVFKKEDENGKL